MKIEKEKYYSLKELSEMNAIPWVSEYRSLRKMVKYDIEKNNNRHFKAIVKGTGTTTRYLIKGENVINFVKKVSASGMIID